MSVSHYKRFEEAPYTRQAIGLLGRLPGIIDATALGGAPVRIPLPISLPQASTIVVSGNVQRSYLCQAGIRVNGDVASVPHFVTSYIDNAALLSAANTGKDAYTGTAIQGFPTYENNLVPLKFIVTPTNLKTFADAACTVGDVAPIANMLNLTVDLFYGVSGGGVTSGGNSYLCRFQDMTVCASNLLALRSLPAFGSARMTINGGAPVIVDVDGNGDGTFDFGRTAFPCQIMYEVFTGAGATGNKIGKITVPQSYGGDIFGNVRAELGVVPFTPKLKRLELWLDPLSFGGAADASAVTRWDDTAGGARHFLPLAATPTLRTALFAKPVVDFTGQALYNNATELRTLNETIVLVLSHRTEATPHGYFAQTFNGAGGLNINNNGGAGVLAVFPGYNAIPGAGENVLQFVVYECDKINGRVRVYLNGSANPVLDKAFDVSAFTTVTTSIGAFYVDQPTAYGALYGSALIGEVLIYSRILRPAERVALATYMRTKWGNAW